MPQLRPFTGIRYAPGFDLEAVTCPPYDVISVAEQKRLLDLHPNSFVRLILPPNGEEKYSRAAQEFRRWISEDILVPDPGECFYLYRADYALGGVPYSTAGLIAALELHPFDDGEVLAHERTMPGPKADRLELLRHTGANLEPLWFVTSAHVPELAQLIESVDSRAAIARATDDAGVLHRMWRVSPGEAEAAVRRLDSQPVVVADGHHRYETSVTYRDERSSKEGPGPWDWTLGLIVDPLSYQPTLLPIHRIARGLPLDELRSRLQLEAFPGDLEELAGRIAQMGPGMIGVASREGRWTTPSPGPLDTAYLAEVFDRWNAKVTYEHDLEQVHEALGENAVAFITAPVRLQTVIDEALQGRRMPPKTTLFWPKPRSGFVLRDLRSRVT